MNAQVNMLRNLNHPRLSYSSIAHTHIDAVNVTNDTKYFSQQKECPWCILIHPTNKYEMQ